MAHDKATPPRRVIRSVFDLGERWDDHEWVAQMKAEIEQALYEDVDAEDWAAMASEQKQAAWKHARLVIGF